MPDANQIVVVVKTNAIALWAQVLATLATLITAWTAVRVARSSEKRAANAEAKAVEAERRSQVSLEVDVLLRLQNEFFSSSEMLKSRAIASMHLRGGADPRPVEDVFDFFETVAMFVNKQVIDDRVVWHTFYHWIHGYFEIAGEQIYQQQRTNPALYEDCTKLHARLVEIEREARRLSVDNPDNWSDEEKTEFLEDESHLWDFHQDAGTSTSHVGH